MEDEIGGTCSTIWKNKCPYEILAIKPEGRRRLGTPRSGRKNNIKTNLKEIGCEGVKWIHLAQVKVQRRALVNMVGSRASEFHEKAGDFYFTWEASSPCLLKQAVINHEHSLTVGSNRESIGLGEYSSVSLSREWSWWLTYHKHLQ
jgi:hypothetical protein